MVFCMQSDVKKSNRRSFLLILFAFGVPIIASYLAYYVWQPEGAVKNYGELIAPVTLPETLTLTQADGKPLTVKDLRGKWVLLQISGGACDAACEKKLYALRQSRLLQGREMDRITRLWVVNDDVAPNLSKWGDKYEGTLVARDASGALTGRLPHDADVQSSIYIIDPLGNVMMRYPADPDLKRMQKDIGTLLRASQIG